MCRAEMLTLVSLYEKSLSLLVYGSINFTQPLKTVDGGLSNNVPVDPNNPTLKIQPWQGEADICPRDGLYSNLNVTIANANIDLTPINLYRFQQMLFPSKPEDFSDFCRRGFHDCYTYLEANGYIKHSKKTLRRRMTFSEEWHEARLRRIREKKKLLVAKTLEEFDSQHKFPAKTMGNSKFDQESFSVFLTFSSDSLNEFQLDDIDLDTSVFESDEEDTGLMFGSSSDTGKATKPPPLPKGMCVSIQGCLF